MTLPFSEVLMFKASETAPPTSGPICLMDIQIPTYLPLFSASGYPTAIAASLAHKSDAPMPQRAAPRSKNHSLPYLLLQ